MSNKKIEDKLKEFAKSVSDLGDLKPFVNALITGLSHQSEDYQAGFIAAMDLIDVILEPRKDTSTGRIE